MTNSQWFYHTINANKFIVPEYIGNNEACYQQGLAAAGYGYSPNQNPYNIGREENKFWEAGFHDLNDEVLEIVANKTLEDEHIKYDLGV